MLEYESIVVLVQGQLIDSENHLEYQTFVAPY